MTSGAVRLGEVATIVRKSVDPVGLADDTVALFSLPAFDLGNGPEVVPPASIKSVKLLVDEPCVLVSKLNPSIRRVWRLDKKHALTRLASTEFIPLVPTDDTMRLDFLYYVCLSSMVQDKLASASNGTSSSHQRVKPEHLLDIEVPLPTTQQQEAIAEVLGAIDAKIDSNRALVSALERVIVRAATDHGTVSRSVASLADFINGGAFTNGASGSGRMIARIRELNDGPNETTVYGDLKVPPDQEVDAGDILFSWSGTLGIYRWAGPSAIVNQHIFKVMPKAGIPQWLLYASLLRALPTFQKIARDKATTMGHIKRQHLEESVVAVPSVDEVGRLNDQLEAPWLLSSKLLLEIRLMRSLRDQLLLDLVTGKRKVREAA
jgi:type I restriction enzyme S subunit